MLVSAALLKDWLASNPSSKAIAEVEALLKLDVWAPLPGPQTRAQACQADILLYGGAAGGGKTDLALGLALTEHYRTLFIRREGVQLEGAKDRLSQILGNRDGFNSQTGIWRLDDAGCQIRFGGVPNAGDEWKYQGQPRDLLVLDEAANLLESQARALMGWVRDAEAKALRNRVLLCSNPPTSAEGRWLIQFFAPWLDPDHPNPAEHGELRWFATMGGEDIEVTSNQPFVLEAGEPLYDFNPDDYALEDVITPLSRSFIPARVADNPHLLGSGYMRTLQAMPEPLRSQMLYGDFTAGMEDDAYQVLPTAWVQAAMDRWRPRSDEYEPGDMTSMGVDVSRGGLDESVISRRHGMWFDQLICLPGEIVPDGPTLGAQVLQHRRDACPVHVDAIGVGTAVVDFLHGQGVQHVPITGSEASGLTDNTGHFTFINQRAEIFWLFRELLDPQNNPTVMLPPDNQLLQDLCAPTYMIRTGNKIQIESKDQIKKRIGRSTDRADAVLYASIITPLRYEGGRPNIRVHRSIGPRR